MEPSVDDMRWALNKAYPGNDWLADVACLSDTEVVKTYRRCIGAGRISK